MAKKIAILFSCSVVTLLSLPSCGGDKPAGGTPSAGAPSGGTPSAASNPAPSGSASTSEKAADAAQDPQKKVQKPKIDYQMVKQMFGTEPSAPAVDNPGTPEKVALGKALYHDASLSKNGNLSCASCHDLANYGVDNKPTSPGSDGKNGERNTPTVYNAHRQFVQFWDGRAPTVEEQALKPVLNPVEHGVADEPALVAKMKARPELVEGFQKAFPGSGDPVTAGNFKLAIGAFERTLVTKSRWDEYLDGNQKALTNEELVGLKTFMDSGCITCHMGRLLGGHMYQKVGLIKPYPSQDTGRMQVTGSEADKFLFKVPTLANCEKTAPYYHDGKIATLEEAVKNMAEIQLGQNLPAEKVAAIVTFLKALTGPLPAEFAKK